MPHSPQSPTAPGTGTLCSTTPLVTLLTALASAASPSLGLKSPQEKSWQQAGIFHCYLHTQSQAEERGA